MVGSRRMSVGMEKKVDWRKFFHVKAVFKREKVFFCAFSSDTELE
jgi:hypothetical protein